ncbi:MAG: glycosyltransferase [Acidobacteriota bacterium]|nr:glycosyltransferase [Acidobacteriota bacterium]
MQAPRRVAYFPDSFHEVNGVAHTSRNFAAYAQRHNLPFLCVRATLDGRAAHRTLTRDANLHAVELRRSALAIPLEKDLRFDPLFWRHGRVIASQLRSFAPEIIHITGPSELGLFGAWFAWRYGIPLAASWHTNLHEYAAHRLAWLTRLLPGSSGSTAGRAVESPALAATLRFYGRARVLFAPNIELCGMIERATRKPCHLMQRGVDTDLFSPARRTRAPRSQTLVLGYVGRLSVEKNVALLVRIERQLRALGVVNVRFVIVGQGDQQEMLRRELLQADMPGVLRGEALAEAYANMDLLVFPSHTDTFGNVVLEALASGVPAVVTTDGGPKFVVREGETGFVVPDDGFAGAIASLAASPERLAAMRAAARAYALTCSWDAVFDRVYAAYESGI